MITAPIISDHQPRKIIKRKKKKKYHTVGTVQKSKRRIVEREEKLDTPNRFIYGCSHSWLGTGTFINIKLYPQ